MAQRENGAVWDDLPVRNNHALLSFGDGDRLLAATSVLREAAFVHEGGLLGRFGVIAGAGSVLHAGRGGVLEAAAMHMVLTPRRRRA